MKRIILSGVLACSMLAVIPVGAAEFNWQRMADPPPTTSDFNWSTAAYWQGGSLPQDGADIGFFLYPSDEYLDSPVPTTVIYDVPELIRFNFVSIIDTAYLTPLTLRIDAPYTFSASEVMVQSFGTMALHGGTVIADYEKTVGSTSADGVVSAGVILQTAGTNIISQTLDIAIGAYNLVGGVLSASRELIESAGNFFQSGGTNTAGSTLVVDGTFTQDGGYTSTDALSVGERGVGTFVLRGGSLDANIETLGNSSAGVFTQSGGTNTAGSLLIGSQAFGTYTLSNGTVDAFGMEINNGVFNQSGGINSLTTAMIGMSDGFIGRYDFSGGALSANAVFVGNHGPGNFLHTGGTSNVNELTIGANGASGTYRLEGTGLIASPARLTGGVEYIGYSGTGVFDHYGSLDSVHAAGLLYIGYDTGGNGSYTMHGNVLLEAGDEVVGRAGNGSFTQHMGSHRIGAVTLKPGEAAVGTGTLTIGELLGGTGAYSMNPTVGIPELWASTEVIGNYGSGVFNQFGGTNTVAGDLYLGRYAGSRGVYELSGISGGGLPGFLPGFPTATTSLSAVDEYIGFRGRGEFNQTGGENLLSGSLFLGGDNIGYEGNGIYALSGGTLSAANQYIGTGGNGIFRQTGGINVAGNILSGGLRVGGQSGTGIYDLMGGNLYAGSMQVGTGTGTGSATFNHTGGNNNVSNVLTIGANGTYNLSGEDMFGSWGRLSAGGIINDGTFSYSGGNLSVYSLPPTGGPPYSTGPDFTNNGTFNISGTGERVVSASVLNNGTVTVTDTSVTFNGTFTNNGVYISDPSSNYFTNLTVNSEGYLVGGAGDNFFIGGNFLNYSEQNESWDTALAYLAFNGFGMSHEFYFGDAGGNRDFSWGTLELSGGGFLHLDGIGDLYVNNLILGDGSSLDLGGLTIYYNILTDNGGSHFGGNILSAAGGDGTNPVPEPSTLLLLASGLAGLGGFRKYRVRRIAL